MTARSSNDPLALFHPAVRAWFESVFDAPTRPQTLGWPAIARRDSTLILVTDRQRQNAHRISVVPRPADVRPRARQRPAMPGALRLAAQGARGRRRTQPSLAAGRDRPGGGRSRRCPRCTGHRRSHRRHASRRPGPFPPGPFRHPYYDARIAVFTSDLERPRGAPLGRNRHRRRNPRPGADQARRPPHALARAADGLCHLATSADRVICHTASPRRGCTVSWRRRKRSAVSVQRSKGQTGARDVVASDRRHRRPTRGRSATTSSPLTGPSVTGP